MKEIKWDDVMVIVHGVGVDGEPFGAGWWRRGGYLGSDLHKEKELVVRRARETAFQAEVATSDRLRGGKELG